MSYDIGIGQCAKIEGDTVVVRLESVMVNRLSPGQPWQRSGTSLLRLNRRVCSTDRPPAEDEEIFVSRSALTRRRVGTLDLTGDGSDTRSVDLRKLLTDVDPGPAAAPTPRGRRR